MRALDFPRRRGLAGARQAANQEEGGHGVASAEYLLLMSRPANAGIQTEVASQMPNGIPEDLGLGVRLISPLQDGGSEIVNKFWTKGRRGLSPIFYGMGAATMAFLPLRLCLLTEGPSDVLLLPSMLRSACLIQSLGFLVSPGLAEASDEQIRIMQSEGSHVLFLIDGDAGGREIRKKILRSGVAEDRIISIQSGDRLMIEDYLAPQIYIEAVNEEFARRGIEPRLQLADLPSSSRPTFLKTWCEARAIAVPSKVDIAYRVLDIVSTSDIVEEQATESLRDLFSLLESRFKVIRRETPPATLH